MAASIVFGKSFQTQFDDDGNATDVTPIDGDYEFVGVNHLRSAMNACVPYGIQLNDWPVYNVERPIRVPLSEALARCQELKTKLLALRRSTLLAEHDFISIAIRIIEKGDVYFVGFVPKGV